MERWLAIIVCLHVVAVYGQPLQISVEQVLDKWCLESPEARQIRLEYENKLLEFANYRKSFLPALAFSLSPADFNRSLKLLQNPEDGSYSYVEDFSNSSSAGISITQKVGITGGEFAVSSNLNYLREFSDRRNRFGTNPLYLSYSQPFAGGLRTYKQERKIQYAIYDNALKEYYSGLADIQANAVQLFMELFLARLSVELSKGDLQISDTLLMAGKALQANGRLTEYEYNQIELQHTNDRYAYEDALKTYGKAFRTLASFLGKPEWEGQEAVVQTPPFSLPLKVDYETVISHARKNSPFALSQERKKIEAERELFAARLDCRLNGNIKISYGLNQYADRFMDAYRKPDYTQGIMVGMQIPVFQWGINRNKLRIAKNDYETAMIAIGQAETDFDDELKNLVDEYNRSMNLWFIADRSYKLAKEQYRLLTHKFRFGKISVYELTAAQQGQYNAMKQYYSSVQNVWSCFCLLRKNTQYDFVRGVELKMLYRSAGINEQID